MVKKLSNNKDMEDTLRAEELERLRIVFNSMNDAVFLSPIDDDGVHGDFVDVNETTCRRLGYTREELLQFNARTINPRANEQKIRAFGREILKNKLARFEAIHQAKDGTQIPVGVTAKLVEIGGRKYVLSLVSDLREKKELETEVGRFGYLIEHMWDEIYVFSPSDYQLQMLNHAALDNLGYTREESEQLLFTDVMHDFDTRRLRSVLTALAEGESPTARFQAEARRKSGDVYPVEIHLQLSHNEVPPVCIANVQDITERRKAEERVRWMATHDSMTGLANRALFLDRLKMAMAQAQRQEHLIAVVYLDIDDFKYVNDSLGHEAGDRLVVEMGKRLKACIRESDTVARLGGDEFAILLTNLADVVHVGVVLDKIRESLDKGLMLDEQEFGLNSSIGVTIYPFDDSDDLTDILKQADSAMYNAKQAGKNRCNYYSRELAEAERYRSRLINGVRRATDRGEMQVWYQPRVDLESGAIHGAEALIRWQHPELGLIMPDQFVGILESSGEIERVGAWVVEQACASLKGWLGIQPGMKMSVNFSARQFNDPELPEKLADIISRYQLNPARIEAEITEGLLLSGTAEAITILERIKDIGLAISLDDFGKGYSSLNYLKQFPIDVIKIDQSFTRDVETDRYSCIIIETLVQLAYKLDLRVTAEGIETEHQRERLLYFGCAEGQGFLFGRPMPASDFTRLLKAQADSSVNVIPLYRR